MSRTAVCWRQPERTLLQKGVMDDVELPNDWAVACRQPPPQSAPHQQEESAATATATAAEPSRKRSKTAAATSGGSSGAGAAGTSSANNTTSFLEPSCSPLGPRGVFDVSVQQAPDRGQVKEMVMASLRKDSDGAALQDEDIQVDCLLCKLPYKKMLNDLFRGGNHCSGGGGNNANNNSDNYNKDALQIPYVTRAYEESFMREVIHAGERQCAKGKQCECMFIDQEQPFVGVEFLLPGERQPPTPHLCVLCCRSVTQQLYYDVMFDKQDFGGVIQRFGNIHSQPGEYALNAMLIAAPSAPVHIMPLPIVSHQRNRYSTFLQGGIKYLKQSRVYFQVSPSTNAFALTPRPHLLFTLE